MVPHDSKSDLPLITKLKFINNKKLKERQLNFLKEIKKTKIKGGCQSGRKVGTHDSKSDLPLDNSIHKKLPLNFPFKFQLSR